MKRQKPPGPGERDLYNYVAVDKALHDETVRRDQQIILQVVDCVERVSKSATRVSTECVLVAGAKAEMEGLLKLLSCNKGTGHALATTSAEGAHETPKEAAKAAEEDLKAEAAAAFPSMDDGPTDAGLKNVTPVNGNGHKPKRARKPKEEGKVYKPKGRVLYVTIESHELAGFDMNGALKCILFAAALPMTKDEIDYEVGRRGWNGGHLKPENGSNRIVVATSATELRKMVNREKSAVLENKRYTLAESVRKEMESKIPAGTAREVCKA